MHQGRTCSHLTVFSSDASVLTCASAAHPPLLLLVDWMDSGPIIFTNESVFGTGPWNCNRLIYPSEEGTAFNFYIGFESLHICVGHYNICIPIKGKEVLMFHKIQELLIIWSLF